MSTIRNLKTIHPSSHHQKLLSQNTRNDGRSFIEQRHIQSQLHTITSALGSCTVKYGNTIISVGITAQICAPLPLQPMAGYLVPNVELSAICNSKFKPGPPPPLAQVTSQELYTILCQSINLDSLCIIPGKAVWVINIDAICLNYDGNLLDSCLLAIKGAIKDLKLPIISIDESTKAIEIIDEDKFTTIDYLNIPNSYTFGIFQGKMIVDPTIDEENVCDSVVNVMVGEEGELKRVLKVGNVIGMDLMNECVGYSLKCVQSV